MMRLSSSLSLSLAQMDVLLGDWEANLKQALAFIEEAADRGSELVILPELWSTGYALDRIGELSSHTEVILAELCGLASRRSLWLIPGSLPESGKEGVYNTAFVISPSGKVVSRYRKIHLFPLMEEDKYMEAGRNLVLAETPWGKVGLMICYDLRFPELARSLALKGARLLVVPAEWPGARLEHWRTLLRARAIENQFFVAGVNAGVNRVGSSDELEFLGSSAIIDPWGQTVVEGGPFPVLLNAEIDLSMVEEVRRKLPCFRDRVPSLYRVNV